MRPCAAVLALVLSAIGASLARAQTPVVIDTSSVAVAGFMGFGAQWDAAGYTQSGVTDHPIMAEFGEAGVSGMVAGGAEAAFPFAAAGTGGLLGSAAFDAWFANVGCH